MLCPFSAEKIPGSGGEGHAVEREVEVNGCCGAEELGDGEIFRSGVGGVLGRLWHRVVELDIVFGGFPNEMKGLFVGGEVGGSQDVGVWGIEVGVCMGDDAPCGGFPPGGVGGIMGELVGKEEGGSGADGLIGVGACGEGNLEGSVA